MAKDNKILATYVIYNSLYKDKRTDVYDIVSEFVKYVILKEHNTSYSQLEISELLNQNFGFQIPALVLKPATQRIDGIQQKNGKYIVQYSKIQENPRFSEMHQKAMQENEIIIDNLISYIKEKSEKKLEPFDRTEVEVAFRNYLLDECVEDEYAKYISAFIIEKAEDENYVKKINEIREGHILYNGLSLNKRVSELGWKSKLTIYLDMEILFHLAGYNGTTFERLAKEFLELVNEANKKEKYITLKFFQETKREIEHFFDTAEIILRNGSVINPGQTAMESILSGCKYSADITEKKANFYLFLNRNHIYEEKKTDFYDRRYDEANFESMQYDEKELADIRLISHINKLRNNKVALDYADAGCILLSETGSVLEFSRQFTLEKENSIGQNTNQKIVPFAINLYTLTNMLWYRLNRALKQNDEPATIDSVLRAKIVLAKFINESIVTQYEELVKKQNEGEIDYEELAVVIAELRKQSKKPENILKDGVNDALKYLCEKDINKYIEDYHSECQEHKKLEKKYKEAQSKLITQQENSEKKAKEYEKLRISDRCKELKGKITLLNEHKQDLERQLRNHEIERERSKKRRRKIAILSYIFYYGIIVIFIIRVGWNIMEPITYILGIPPLLYLAISKIYGINWGITEWINSYKNNEDFILVQKKYDKISADIREQEVLLNEELEKLNQ